MHPVLLALAAVIVVVLLLALFSWGVGRGVAAALRPQGRWMEVDGERIHFRELGSGPPIVLVHGLMGESRNFDYLPLADLAQRWRLVLVDRPGSGHSPRRDDRKAGLAAQAKLLAGFIRAMHFPQKPLLVGHSLGGAISLALALQEPDCVAGLGLVAPLTHVTAQPPPPFRCLHIRQPWLRRLYGAVLSVPHAMLAIRSRLGWIFGPDATPRDFPVKGGGLLSVRPEAYYAGSTDMCALEAELPRQQERYGELQLPVFILFGRADRLLDFQRHGQGLQDKVPQARLDALPGGHMLPVTAPAETAAWLEQAARATLQPAG